jgi:hypothetical protein|tara:strand:- start:1 stop:276 length:276 start_codon:yes stop_codon:yes gene_type:complete
MFNEGDIVTYKELTGKIVFSCELSISILIGDEFPKQTQTRIVVYNYEWDKVKLVSDSSENGTKAQVQLMNRPQFPPKVSKPCIVVSSSKTT